MSASLTQPLKLGPSRLTKLLLAVGGLAATFALAGPVKKAEALTCYPGDFVCFKTDQITVVNNFITIHADKSRVIYNVWSGRDCAGDWDGDGLRGRARDRGYCILSILRLVSCGTAGWAPKKLVCQGATSISEWRDINEALSTDAPGPLCLAIHVGSTVSPPYNWTYRNIFTRTCDWSG